jgi:long-chain acyl-CoA synthetase
LQLGQLAAKLKTHEFWEDAVSKIDNPTAGQTHNSWLKSYHPSVPHQLPPLAFSSVSDLLLSACQKNAGKPAFSLMGKSINYAQVEKASEHIGAYLQSKGLAKGARVALMMPNILQYPVAILGVLRAGYAVVNVNPLYTPRELEHQLKDSGAEAIIIIENFATTLEAVIAKTQVKHVIVTAMGDMLGLKGHIVNFVVRKVKKMVPAYNLPGSISFKTMLAQGATMSLQPVQIAPSDVAFLQYTGGTTGVSKGATLTHSNILSNIAQNRAWLIPVMTNGVPDDMTIVCALPLYHIFALTVCMMMGMDIGGNNILIPNPRDIPAFVKDITGKKLHLFPGLNTLFNALLNNADFNKLDFSSMLLTLGGGMAVQSGVAERWQALTKHAIHEGYGLSETSPVASANRFDIQVYTGTVGLPLPSTEFAIRDDDNNDMPRGEVGEICIRGPQVMAGYWNRPDETAKVMSADGYFKSGDLGFMDENGYTKIVDRKKDMILVSGFNVYPNEIEDVISKHPGVLECAAVGVPDEHSGEAVKLFVVKRDENLTAESVKDFCKDQLTNYKRPKHVEFRKDLPKTNVGKILRRELRDSKSA